MIQTGNGITNRPITKLYPLEIRSESPPNIEEQDTDDVNECDDDDTTNTTTTQPSPRSTVREAATKARQRFCEWAQIIGMPRRMLRPTELLEYFRLLLLIGLRHRQIM